MPRLLVVQFGGPVGTLDKFGDKGPSVAAALASRLDLAVPEASLIVEKAVGAVPHTGGKRFEPDSEMAQTIVEWIRSGVPQDPADVPYCTSIDIYPKQAVLDGEGAAQRVTVCGTYSDGTTRDVTRLALFLSNNENSAAISADGIVTAGARGEAYVMARFATHTVGSQYIVLPKGLQFTFPAVPENNYIDRHVNAKLQRLQILPSDLTTDAEILRRVSFDLIGLPPAPEEIRAFQADKTGTRLKRSKMIDRLMARPRWSGGTASART